MERLKMMKENLMSCVQAQMADLKHTNAKELGEAIDMIKDLEEAIYYCTIVEAMKKKDTDKDAMRYTYPPVMYNGGSMNMDKERMYYTGRMGTTGGRMYYDGESMRYVEPYDRSYPMEIRDYREGRSPMTRRTYMESKEMHHGKEKQMKELEKYIGELTQDIMEMIDDSTPDEKAMLAQKLVTLAEKIK